METPFHLSKKIVEGVSEIEGGRFVGCDRFQDRFLQREFPPGNPMVASKPSKPVVAGHEKFCYREFDASCQLVCCIGLVECSVERHRRDAFDFVNVDVGIGTFYGSYMGCVALRGNSCDFRFVRVRRGRG